MGRGASGRSYALHLGALAVAYYVAARLSLEASLVGGVVTPIWPPTGIAVVGFLVAGFRTWPAVTAAALLVNLPNTSAGAAGLIAVGNTAAPLLAAWLLERSGFRKELDRLRDALSLVLLGALLAMTVSASFGTGALLLDDAISRDSLASTWTLWWAGDGTGVLVFAPLLFSLGHARALGWRRAGETAAVVAALAVVAYGVFHGEHNAVYLAFPFVIWAALRARQLGAALAALTVVVAAVWAAIDQVGPFADESFLERMLTLQVYNAVVALTSFVLAAVIAERTTAYAALSASLERERRITETLQRNLLPDRLPEVPGMEFASRYLPGGAGLHVGGDWYDVIALSRGRIALTVGDVVGRGLGAAAAMGQLRTALRAYALEATSPAAVVDRMSRLVGDLEAGQMATLLYGVLDADAGTLRYACAGHLPPLLARPDGSATYLEDGRSLPLGVTRSARHEAVVRVEPGSTLVLFTDGLVERRDGSIDEGMEALRRAVEGFDGDLERLCDERILAPPRPEADQDDVAVLAVRLLPVPGEVLSLTLTAEPANLASVRRAVGPWLGRAGATRAEMDDLVLAMSEAVSNAIEHAYGPAGGPLEVHATVRQGVVTMHVRDRGKWRPPREDGRGRGLQLMRRLVDDVALEHTAEGTAVTLTRRLGSEPAATTPPDVDTPSSPAGVDDVLVVRLGGELDRENVHGLYDELVAELGHDRGLVLDLTTVEYVDSAGLKVIYRLSEALAPRRQPFRVVAPEDSVVRRVLTLSSIDSLAPITASVDAAVADIESSDSLGW